MMALSLRDRLKLLTVVDLKKELKDFGAIQTGVKDILVDRLAYLIEREQAGITQDPSAGEKIIGFLNCVIQTEKMQLTATKA